MLIWIPEIGGFFCLILIISFFICIGETGRKKRAEARRTRRRERQCAEVDQLSRDKFSAMTKDEQAAFDLCRYMKELDPKYPLIILPGIEKIVLNAAEETGLLDSKKPKILEAASIYLSPYSHSPLYFSTDSAGRIAAQVGLPFTVVCETVVKRQKELKEQRRKQLAKTRPERTAAAKSAMAEDVAQGRVNTSDSDKKLGKYVERICEKFELDPAMCSSGGELCAELEHLLELQDAREDEAEIRAAETPNS